jgi:hypothetical protein
LYYSLSKAHRQYDRGENNLMQNLNTDYPFFIAQGGGMNGQRWLIKQELIIGRVDSCDIVVPDRQVSRQHARLVREHDGVFLEDLGSKNGTYHNNQPVISRAMLQDGDVVQIALAQEFVFLSSDATLPLDELPVIPVAGHLIHLDNAAHRVYVSGIELLPPLSKSQFDLLQAMYMKPGENVTREEAIAAVWGSITEGVSEQALDALVRRLRERLSQIDATHEFIITMRGHGFRLDNPIKV